MGRRKNLFQRGLSFALSFAMAFAGIAPPAQTRALAAAKEDEPYVVSMSRPVYASSSKNSSAYLAVDGDLSTRWESEWDSDTEWIYVDLGKATQITSVYLNWEAAGASEYAIEFSDNEMEWKTQQTVTDGEPGERTISLSGKARYVRVTCKKKMMAEYGYSLFEFQVWGLDGLTPRPADYGENLAQNRTVKASSLQKEWWMIKKDENGQEMKDENGEPVYDQSNVLAELAVDGKTNTSWHSAGANAAKREDDQWLYVDLGTTKEIGRIILSWQDAARAYQIQVSDDASNWKTIYARMNEGAVDKNLPIYASGRFVRVYCIGSWGFNGYGIKELEVYAYREGDEKVTYDVEEAPKIATEEVSGSSASYATDDVKFPMAKPPVYLDEDLQMPNRPVASNDWWQSMTILKMGNGLVAMPLRVKHTTNGLDIVGVNDCWYGGEERSGALGTAYVNSKTDFSITPEGMSYDSLYDQVAAYSDYSVTAQLCDEDGVIMTNTVTKGCPYVFSEFNQVQDIELRSDHISGIFSEEGDILTGDGQTLTTDHIGLEITDDDSKDKTASSSWFCISFPDKTQLMRVGNKIKVHLPAANGYISVGTMTKRADLNAFYQHGYAFVRNTSVTYQYDEMTSKITTNYAVTTEVKRDGFSDETMQCLLPHQWKKSDAVLNNLTYASQRGTLKAMTGNRFETVDTFYGMVPQFTTPQNSEYDSELLNSYLAEIEKSTNNPDTLTGGDAYWQGKTLHPLALAVMVADQTGNSAYKEMFLERMRYIFEDWMTYSGPDDECYFYYDKNWGTLYYRYSEFGANTGICDHHFTYGYFVFAATVLAAYDDAFYEEYKDMIDLIVRDYASPYDNDDLFCRFRSYDLYEGHSWAGGYADNDDGNNQEAGGESLFGWVGMYLWAIRSGNNDFRDAAIFGFTTELNAIKQYWFNYDRDNWPKDYPHWVAGQNYGATIFYATFFDGNSASIYGIHWLPVAEWITYYGMEQDQIKTMYEGLETEIKGQQQYEEANGGSPENVSTTYSTWQHIFVPLRSQYDPDGALEDFWKAQEMGYQHSATEKFNTYWFANNMKDIGVRTYDIYPIGGAAASVYESRDLQDGEKTYTAIAWNPTDHDVTIQFTNGTEIVGSATIGAKALVRFDPLKKGLVQTATPEFSHESDVYDDTQYVKITTDTPGAQIFYTTDGSNPTSDSKTYSGRIPVSSTTTIKAIAHKDGYIDSAMQSVKIEIAGSSITTGKNIAVGKMVSASSQGDVNKAANVTDYNGQTRWESDKTDDQWIQIDLSEVRSINKVKISWENAYAKEYQILVSENGETWNEVYAETAGDGGIDEAVFEPVSAKFVKVQGVKRATEYGYSIYEIGIYEARGVSKPQFSLTDGSYEGNQLVSIASGTKGVEIRYTTDGSEPDENSLLYIPRMTVWQEAVTIKAKAFKKGMFPSEAAQASYRITGGSRPPETDTYDETDDFKATPQDKEIEEELLAGEAVETVPDSLLTGCLSYKKDVTVSSSENDNTKQNVTDGKLDTVWSSAFANMENEERFDQWCMIDLGTPAEFNEVKIHWNTLNNHYEIQVSDDQKQWESVYVSEKDSTEDRIDICRFDTVSARYVKLQGLKVGDAYGYSLKEVMVYLSDEEQPLGTDVSGSAKLTVSSGEAADLKDGKSSTVWQPVEDTAPTIEADLYKTYRLDRVVLKGTENYTGTVTIQVKKGDQWEDVVSKTAENTAVFKFDAVETRYVRVLFTEGTDTLAVSEIEIYTEGSADVAPVTVEYYTPIAARASTEQKNVANILEDNRNYWQAQSDDEAAWCCIDLGESREVNFVSIDWEASCAAVYDIYLTDDIDAWKPDEAQKAYEGATASKAGIAELVLTNPQKARYVVMRTRERSEVAAQYGVAVYEMKAGLRSAISVEWVKIAPKSANLAVGQSYLLSYIISPSNADNTAVSFSSDDEEVAVVSDGGEIRAKAAGIANIKVSSLADDTISASMEVRVRGPLKIGRPQAKLTGEKEITISWETVAHAAGYNIYHATSRDGKYTKLNGQLLTENSYKDTVLASGRHFYKVEAVAGEDDAIYQNSGQSQASVGVTVAAEVQDPSKPGEGNTEQTPGGEGNTEQTPGGEGNTEQTPGGEGNTEQTPGGEGNTEQTPGGEGSTEKKPGEGSTEQTPGTESGGTTGQLPNGDSTDAATKKVSRIQLPSVINVAKGSSVTVETIVLPADAANTKLIWTSSDPGTATVDSGGKVSGIRYGVATITAQAADGSNVKASVSVRVGYKITYKLKKGKNHAANPASYYKQKVKLKAPSRKGYAFKGWYSDKKYKKKVKTISKKAKKNYTLYAKWEKIRVGKTDITRLLSPKKSQIKLNVRKVRKAKGYQVLCAADRGFKRNKKVQTSRKTNLTVNGLKAGETYYVKVRAYQEDSTGRYVYGAYTKVIQIAVKK